MLGIICITFAASMFISVFITSYNTTMSTSFISLEYNKEHCVLVKAPLNLKAQFDFNGNWQNSYAFVSSDSLFYMDFSSVYMNETSYSLVMGGIYSILDSFGNQSLHFNMAQQIVHLATVYDKFNQIDARRIGADLGSDQAFLILGTEADPVSMFNAIYSYGPVTLVSGNAADTIQCAKLMPEISQIAGKVSILYTAPFHSANTDIPYHTESCYKILNPATLKSSPNGQAPTNLISNVVINALEGSTGNQFTVPVSPINANFEIEADMAAMVVAIAVNTGNLQVKNLIPQSTSNIFGYPASLKQYKFSRFPNMDYIYCVDDGIEYIQNMNDKTTQLPLCFVRLKEKNTLTNFALPIMLSVANDPRETDIFNAALCTCPIPARYVEACNLPNFVYMLVGINEPPTPAGFRQVIKQLGGYVNKQSSVPVGDQSSYQRFMESTFDVSKLLPRNYPATNDTFVTNIQATIDKGLAFCDKECYVILIQAFGVAPAISNGATLTNITCSAKAYPNQQRASKFIRENPPVPLQEPYYKCHNTWQTAFNQGIGIANGVTLSAISLFALFAFPLIVYMMESFGFIEQKSNLGDDYDTTDRALALDELALQILRVRDGDKRGISPGGVLEKLAEDLVRTVSSTARINDEVDAASLGQGENYDAEPDVIRHIKPRLSASMFLDLEASQDFEANTAAIYPNKSSVSSAKGTEKAGGLVGVSTKNPLSSKNKYDTAASVQDKL